MRNAAELRMTPSRCRSCAMWRVLQPGRSNTNLVSEGFNGSRAAHANHRANASTTATTSLKNVRTEYSSLDDERHRCAAPQDKAASVSVHGLVFVKLGILLPEWGRPPDLRCACRMREIASADPPALPGTCLRPHPAVRLVAMEVERLEVPG